MTRLCIAVEGTFTQDGRFIEPGALHWDKDLDLLVRPDWSQPESNTPLVGLVQAMEREGNLITAEVMITHPAFDGQEHALCLEVDSAQFVMTDQEETQIMRVTNARVRGIFLAHPDLAPWPEVVHCLSVGTSG
jgi:hypothetical protein